MQHYDPEIYLSLDTCFAKKRWAMPEDWAPLVADLGIRYVELSADTEADPMYHGAEYLRDWDRQVAEECAAAGLSVASLYSGHGSYSTLGLLHPDPAVVQRMVDHWVKPAIDRASKYDASLGFFFHAVSERDLHDPMRYAATMRRLETVLADLCRHAQAASPPVMLSLEQMYTPNQPPWTIRGTVELIERVQQLSGAPLFVTVDTGHAWAQRNYLPGAAAATLPHLTANDGDSAPYRWLGELGAWSPIVHLQQTDGKGSAHRPFTAEQNEGGIIHPEAVLKALARSARNVRDGASGSPSTAPTPKIYLTLEIFAGTADDSRELLRGLRESVAYWRRWIPVDGRPLSQLTADIDDQ